MARSEVLIFGEELQPGTGDDFQRTVEKPGTISRVTIHFPPGTNALVDVRVFKGSQQIVPRDGAINLDDYTVPIETDVPVRKGDTITVKIDNADDTNPHNVQVIAQITPQKGQQFGGDF